VSIGVAIGTLSRPFAGSYAEADCDAHGGDEPYRSQPAGVEDGREHKSDGRCGYPQHDLSAAREPVHRNDPLRPWSSRYAGNPAEVEQAAGVVRPRA
jgi:hypothetical protein